MISNDFKSNKQQQIPPQVLHYHQSSQQSDFDVLFSQQDYRQIMQKLQQQSSKNKLLQAKISQIIKQLSIQKSKKIQLNKQLQVKTTIIKKLTKDIFALSNKCLELEMGFNQFKQEKQEETNIIKMQQTLKTQNLSIEIKTKQINQQQQQICLLKKQIEKLKQQTIKLQLCIQSQKQQKINKVAQLQQKIVTLQQQVASLQQKVASLQQKVASLQQKGKQISNLQQQIFQAQQNLRIKSQQLQISKQLHSEQIKQIEKKLANLQTHSNIKIQTLQSQNKGNEYVSKTNQNFCKINQNLQKQNAKLKQQIQQFELQKRAFQRTFKENQKFIQNNSQLAEGLAKIKIIVYGFCQTIKQHLNQQNNYKNLKQNVIQKRQNKQKQKISFLSQIQSKQKKQPTSSFQGGRSSISLSLTPTIQIIFVTLKLAQQYLSQLIKYQQKICQSKLLLLQQSYSQLNISKVLENKFNRLTQGIHDKQQLIRHMEDIVSKYHQVLDLQMSRHFEKVFQQI